MNTTNANATIYVELESATQKTLPCTQI